VKYYPWNGGSFGGSLDFEQNGKAYRIIRRFDKFSATQDEFSLIDLSTNSECNDFSENIGEEIFGVDVDGFLRSTFSNGESTLNEMPASVRTKISSNLDIADDFDGYESAQLKISEALKALSIRVNQGDLSAVLNAIIQAEELGVSIGELLRIQGDMLRKQFLLRSFSVVFNLSKILFIEHSLMCEMLIHNE
jgi:DNA repair exonuclease SbcCD ATPase subunit